jgi:hypothetical protein
MGTKVTLNLPDEVYRQAETAARQARRPLPDVLAEVITQAFPSFSVSPQREQMEREQRAYERMHAELVARYLGEYVAIHAEALVDHDPDITILAQRVHARLADQVVHIRQVEASLDEPELRVRTPRFAD